MTKGMREIDALPLTGRQHQFMLVLQRYLERDPDRGVSYDELKVELGLNSKSSVFRLVEECIARGRLARSPRLARSLRVLSPVDDRYDGDHPLPIPSPLARFTDADIILEAARRGLVIMTGN